MIKREVTIKLQNEINYVDRHDQVNPKKTTTEVTIVKPKMALGSNILGLKHKYQSLAMNGLSIAESMRKDNIKDDAKIQPKDPSGKDIIQLLYLSKSDDAKLDKFFEEVGEFITKNELVKINNNISVTRDILFSLEVEDFELILGEFFLLAFPFGI